MIVAASIGNSRITVALMAGSEVRAVESRSARDEARWPELFAWIDEKAPPAPRAFVSVNPSCEERFLRAVRTSWLAAGRDFPVPMMNRTDRPEQTGLDRLLAAYGASRLFGPPAVVVDFGTAFTFNAVDGQGAFVGGAIVPGLDTALEGLNRRCAQLPRLERPEGPVPVLGKDTAGAIRSGIFHGYVGLVDALVRKLASPLGPSCTVAATGGDARLFVDALPLISRHEPHLLLRGVALAFEAAGPR